jgi:hypothetical protein
VKFIIGGVIVAANAGIVIPSLVHSWPKIMPAHGSPHTAALAVYAVILLASLGVLAWLARPKKAEPGPGTARPRYGSSIGGGR